MGPGTPLSALSDVSGALLDSCTGDEGISALTGRLIDAMCQALGWPAAHVVLTPTTTPSRAGVGAVVPAGDHAIPGLRDGAHAGRPPPWRQALERPAAVCTPLCLESAAPAQAEVIRRLKLRARLTVPFVIAGRVEAVLEFFCCEQPEPVVVRWLELTAEVLAGRLAHQRLARNQRLSELRYRRVLDHTNVAIMIDDPEGRVVYANETFRSLFGLEPDELRHLVFEDHVAPHDRAALREHRERRRRGEDAPRHLECDGLRKDGTPMRLEVSTIKVIEQGQLIGTQSAIRDITGHQSPRPRSRGRLPPLFDVVPLALLVLDPDTLTVLHANVSAATLYGLSVKALRGLDFPGLSADPELDRQRLERLLEHAAPVSFETEQRTTAAGVLHVELRATPVPLGGELRLLCCARDISETVRAREQLAQAQRMEAMGLLAGGVAHDFNNIITVIAGYAELAALNLPFSSPLQADLGEISLACAQASDLTRQLLLFSRSRESEGRRVVELNEVVRGIDKMLGRLLRSEVKLEVSLSEVDHKVEVDPGQLERVLINLVVNAHDAMPKGGTITLETSRLEVSDPPRPEHHGLPEGSFVVLTVADDGIGMDEDTQARIFEPLFTTKSADRGTGLGLSTVYTIVKRSGGLVRVDSELGVGTRFEVLLPEVTAAASATRSTGEFEALVPGYGTILLVEDNGAIRRFARATLESAGYRVIDAADGRSALQKVAETSVDLLVTDLALPGLSGLALHHELLPRNPHLPVLFLTAPGLEDEHLAAIAGHPSLHKPFTLAQLTQRIGELLDVSRRIAIS